MVVTARHAVSRRPYCADIYIIITIQFILRCINKNNHVDMIRHYHMIPYLHLKPVMTADLTYTKLRNIPDIAQTHLAPVYFAKIMAFRIAAYRNEIYSAIIVMPVCPYLMPVSHYIYTLRDIDINSSRPRSQR